MREEPCNECGGLGATHGFLGSKRVEYPCSKGCPIVDIWETESEEETESKEETD
tara:strand:- start:1100 stop:1261 length:162 start_codon:yes stop_codon:yes gene_type:complete